MSIILHITQRQHWDEAQEVGIYRNDSLRSEGFIHCSTPLQVIKVANRFYAGQRGLVLLCIYGGLLQAPLRYEAIETGEQFPHLYGALNLNAVIRVLDFEPGTDGKFKLPEALVDTA